MKTNKKYKTDKLINRATFFDGLGSVFNISGNYFRIRFKSSGFDLDRKAIENDWGVVGNDIREALRKAKSKN